MLPQRKKKGYLPFRAGYALRELDERNISTCSVSFFFPLQKTKTKFNLKGGRYTVNEKKDFFSLGKWRSAQFSFLTSLPNTFPSS